MKYLVVMLFLAGTVSAADPFKACADPFKAVPVVSATKTVAPAKATCPCNCGCADGDCDCVHCQCASCTGSLSYYRYADGYTYEFRGQKFTGVAWDSQGRKWINGVLRQISNPPRMAMMAMPACSS